MCMKYDNMCIDFHCYGLFGYIYLLLLSDRIALGYVYDYDSFDDAIVDWVLVVMAFGVCLSLVVTLIWLLS